MVKMPSQAAIKDAYTASIGAVPGKYSAGVRETNDWQQKASSPEAESLYGQKVQEAVSNQSRAKAVAKVSNADWQNAASSKGASRIATGMTAGANKQAQNYEPIRQALASVELPARSADPLANVDARVKPIVSAAVNAKKNALG